MKKRRLYNIIRWLIPYGIVSAYKVKKYKRRHNFIELFKQYVDSKQKCEFIEENPYESIVSVQGFGYSGSGAIVDLLREYNNTLVIGLVDVEGSVTSQEIKCDEVDILRLAGGLFEIEKYLESNNIFQNDALLHRVVAQLNSTELYRNNLRVRPYFFEFMRQICEILTDAPKKQDYNAFLNHNGANDILYLKKISLVEYRELCKRFLNSIFAIFHEANNDKPILVLDQVMNDWEFDIERYKTYIPNLKIIMVYRDPRDVYAFARKVNVGWIPHKSADVFIKWYNILLKSFNIKEQKDYLVVQFERLIDYYDETTREVEGFLGIKSAAHTKSGMCLDVTKSKENINIWKENKGLEEDCSMIKQMLPLLCYNE